jgi:hypothetical protein
MFSLYGMYQSPGTMVFGLFLIIIWVTIWKGIALWHAAQSKHKGWFVAILILNTLGILPIIYLLWFKPSCKTEKVVEESPKKEVAKTNTAKKTVKKAHAKKKVAKKKTVKKVVKKKK